MGYDYSMTVADEDSLAAIGVALLVYGLLMLAIAVVFYVFESLGMYTIAKRRTIKHAWLAWIPVANLWVLGCISDQYRYVVKGKVTNRRKILLALGIVSAVLNCVMLGCFVNMFVQMLLNLTRFGYMSDAQIINLLLPPMMGSAGVGMVASVAAIAQVVFQYMSLYDLYSSCDPRNNVLFLVLGILFNVVQPFFIFACRNKDFGMPPRKQAIPEQQPTWQPPQEPEE